ncbi:SDR family NAD(P)-dependent oxidoreductase [Yinghuangia sp. YIM S09857]|uniref:SDR family NAD(P)-dependent oxidoreductase n=1 Tax=Yinghuangia sp. YIM S09857 TaxID=3436929 RepID=UPI003F529965
MREFGNRVAAVTGAGSGIGRALAVELARRGALPALADIDGAGLWTTAEMIERVCPGRCPTVTEVDVAARDEVQAWADEVVGRFGGVDLVINNAGVGVVAPVEEVIWEDVQWLMGVNFWGVVHGTTSFLPYLRHSTEGHLVNVASVFALVGVPAMSAYCASKSAVCGFTDAVRQELRLSPSGVRVSTVLPGGVSSAFARSVRTSARVDADALVTTSSRVALTAPEGAARAILRGVSRNRARVYVGADARVIDWTSRLLGTGIEPFVRGFARRLMPASWKRP